MPYTDLCHTFYLLLYDVSTFHREFNALALVIYYLYSQMPLINMVLQCLLNLLSGQQVECVDNADRHLQHHVAILDVPLFQVDHTADRAHRRSSLPKAVLSISQIRTVLREMSLDSGDNNYFDKLPHVAKAVVRSIRKGVVRPLQHLGIGTSFAFSYPQITTWCTCIRYRCTRPFAQAF